MADHDLIQTHLATLARSLPANIVDELADGLTETWHRKVAAGLPPSDAAEAVGDFASDAVDTVGDAAEAVGDFASDTADAVGDAFSDAAGAVADFLDI